MWTFCSGVWVWETCVQVSFWVGYGCRGGSRSELLGSGVVASRLVMGWAAMGSYLVHSVCMGS